MSAALTQSDIKRITEEARKIFQSEDEEFDQADATFLVDAPVPSPEFPTLIVGLAIMKDAIDSAQLTLIGYFFTVPVTIIVGVILFIWTLGKISGGWWKKRLIGYLWKRYILMVLVELSPVGGIVPATTIFVLMAHYREEKIVRLANLALEEIHRLGIVA